MSIFLYVLLVLLWGTTWIAVKYQLGEVDPTVSIFYRFLIAASGLTLFALFSRYSLKFRLKDHLYLFLLGLGMFSMHAFFLYKSTAFLISGFVSLIFSFVSVFNILNMWIFFKVKPTLQILFGALIGMTGICVFFTEEMSNFSFTDGTFIGIIFGLLGALTFSLGNLVGKRNQLAGYPLIPSTAWGMIYGTIVMGLYSLFANLSFQLPTTSSYWISLLYLAVPGSIFSFLAYLTLIKTIGPERAGYSAILFPVVALLISIVYEGYEPTSYDLIGMILIFIGNIIILYKPQAQKQLT